MQDTLKPWMVEWRQSTLVIQIKGHVLNYQKVYDKRILKDIELRKEEKYFITN